ncbi:Serine/threonine-protein kinase pkn1 [Gimesia alba]|uniref:Serine/threonine-protein kinase pkn1 n=1 Tax=Gimesia alba TaxID=2527973 RepID=A0A517RP79_9PLAN|nr:SUMF1/EgtB/PvdO family nonheme iron enzyme [Gimesia alba]QDT45703.1 Serine/threonine-protein kinase pkn1 [Gimesia alba]
MGKLTLCFNKIVDEQYEWVDAKFTHSGVLEAVKSESRLKFEPRIDDTIDFSPKARTEKVGKLSTGFAALLIFFLEAKIWSLQPADKIQGNANEEQKFSLTAKYLKKLKKTSKKTLSAKFGAGLWQPRFLGCIKNAETNDVRTIVSQITEFDSNNEKRASLNQNLLNPRNLTIQIDGKTTNKKSDIQSIINWIKKSSNLNKEDLEETNEIDAILNRYCKRICDLWDEAYDSKNDDDRIDRFIEPHYGLSPDRPFNKVIGPDANRDDRHQSIYEHVDGTGEEPLFRLLEAPLLCITEDAGCGKTVLSRHLEMKYSTTEWQQQFFEGRPCLAVLWSQHWPGTSKKYGLTVRKALIRRLKELLPDDKHQAKTVVDVALREGRVVLILDSLDQATTKSRRLLDQFLNGGKEVPNCRVIVTSRYYAVFPQSEKIFRDQRWRFARIEPFTRQQQDEYFSDFEEEQRTILNEMVPDWEMLADQLQVPEVLRLVREQVERHILGKPVEPFRRRGDLYWTAAKRMLQRALKKSNKEWTGDFRAEHIDDLKRIICTTAYVMLQKKCLRYAVPDEETGVDVADIRIEVLNRCSKVINDASWSNYWEVLEDTELTDRGLLEARGEQILGFRSLKSMEFYVGLYLARYLPLEDIDELKQTISKEHWNWAWRFALEMKKEVGAQKDSVLYHAVKLLFARPESATRPTELMYHAWPLLGEAWGGPEPEPGWNVDESRPPLKSGKEILEEFRDGADRALELMAFQKCPPEGWEHPHDRDSHEFFMGSAPDIGHESERPRHRVRMPTFEMQTTTVTREQYRLFDPQLEVKESDCFEKYAKEDHCPVICASWYDAILFACWLGIEYALPTETQWEFSCRAGHDGERDLFSLANKTNVEKISTQQVNFNPTWDAEDSRDDAADNKYRQCTVPVSGNGDSVTDDFVPNAFGFWHMHGNVWEWCQDGYSSDFYLDRIIRQLPQQEIHVAKSATRVQKLEMIETQADKMTFTADLNDSVGSLRVLRGGSWCYLAGNCRSAYRYRISPDIRFNTIGFRLCRMIVSPESSSS